MITTATLERSPIKNTLRLLIIEGDRVTEYCIDKFYITGREVRLPELPVAGTVEVNLMPDTKEGNWWKLDLS